jgi:hypothetical protein
VLQALPIQRIFCYLYSQTGWSQETGSSILKKTIPKKKKAASILDKIVEAKMPEVEELQDEYDLSDYIAGALEIEDHRDFRARLRTRSVWP